MLIRSITSRDLVGHVCMQTVMRRQHYPVSRCYSRSVGNCRVPHSSYLLETSFQLLIGSASNETNILAQGGHEAGPHPS